MKPLLFSFAFSLAFTFIQAQEKVQFNSLDGLEITGDIYEADPNAPVIVLCHQAGWSRGEYLEIAPKLVKMGFNCIAIDQRSGNEINGIKNETNQRATESGLATTYLDAEQDIIAAVNFAHEKWGKKVIVWGSSYSASLVLKVARENDKVNAVISFSPGEYFKEKLNLGQTINGLSKPTWLTSSLPEASDLKKLALNIEPHSVTQFIPTLVGHHGSRALWEDKQGNPAYWESLTVFLSGLK